MFNRFLTAWRFTRDLKFNERYDELPWTPEDQDNLQRFLLGVTGSKFRMRLLNLAITKALESVAVSDDPLYHAGTAYGIQLTNLYIDGHLPTKQPAEDTITSGEDIEQFLNQNG